MSASIVDVLTLVEIRAAIKRVESRINGRHRARVSPDPIDAAEMRRLGALQREVAQSIAPPWRPE